MKKETSGLFRTLEKEWCGLGEVHRVAKACGRKEKRESEIKRKGE